MWTLLKTGSGAVALIIPVSLVECEMRGKTAVGARATQAYQMLAVDAACAGLASHEAVREPTTLFDDQKCPAAEVETDCSFDR